MVETTQINLRVSEDQKKRWEDYLEEEGRFSTVSELIRASVEAEISHEQSKDSVGSPAISNDINQLKEDLRDLRGDVRWIRDQHQDAVDITDLAQDVYDSLETLPDPPSFVPDEVENKKKFQQREAAQQIILPKNEADDPSPQTATAIADRLDVSQQDVRDAINHLQDQFLPVVEVEIDDRIHYFKDE